MAGIHIRAAQALELWQAVCLDLVRGDAPDLTMRQITILLIVYNEPPPHTVRALAARLKVTKPVITRALDTMGAKGLVSRHRDPADGRNVLIARTVGGANFLDLLARRIASEARGLSG